MPAPNLEILGPGNFKEYLYLGDGGSKINFEKWLLFAYAESKYFIMMQITGFFMYNFYYLQINT